jgi:putative FmdB family regulatory protein
MPFYEYQCRACSAQVEVLQKLTAAPLKKCPECGQNKLAKLVSAPVFRLKGGGWYETDFKTDKDNKRNLVDADKGEGKGEGKADGTSDAKPAGQAEAKSGTDSAGKADAKPDAKPPSAPVKPARPAARKVGKRKASR